MNTEELEKCVPEFMEKFNLSLDSELWERLFREEHGELKEAAANFLKELADVIYTYHGMEISVQAEGSKIDPGKLEKITPMKGLLGDLFEVVTDSDIFGEIYMEVHKSNMSKLQADGTVKYREDGKVLKGDNYQEPDLSKYLLDELSE